MTAGDELEAALQRGWSFDELEVYADHLLSKNDPRGDVVALDLFPRPEQPSWTQRRRGALAAWLGNTLAARAGHLVQHGFLHELRDGMYPSELLDSPAGTFLRGYTTFGRTRVRGSLERLASRPRPWLSRLTIAQQTVEQCSDAVVRALIAATPRLEELCVVGQLPFAAFPHPAVKRVRLDATCYGLEIDAVKVRIDVPANAPGPRISDADLELVMDLVELAPDCNQLYMHAEQFSEPLPAIIMRLVAAQMIDINGPVVRLASHAMYLNLGGNVAEPELPVGTGYIELDRRSISIPLAEHSVFVRACLGTFPVAPRMYDTLIEYLVLWSRALNTRVVVEPDRLTRIRLAFNALLELRGMWPVDIGTVEQWTFVEQLVFALGAAGASGGYLRGPNYYWY